MTYNIDTVSVCKDLSEGGYLVGQNFYPNQSKELSIGNFSMPSAIGNWLGEV